MFNDKIRKELKMENMALQTRRQTGHRYTVKKMALVGQALREGILVSYPLEGQKIVLF